jgi:cytochrome b561
MTAEASRYDRVAITLHWLIALGILAQIGLGFWMIDIPKQPAGVRAYWLNLHKSIGLTLALLILVRLGWRLAHRPPPLPGTLPRWQLLAARANHGLLYLCMLVMPLSGFLGSTFSGYPIKYFGMTLPTWGGKDEALKELLSVVHWASAWLFALLIALHVAAALRHRLARDGLFERMWPGSGSAARVREDLPAARAR